MSKFSNAAEFMKKWMIILGMVSATFVYCSKEEPTEIVDTEYGQVRGVRYDLQGGAGVVDAFLGVPFARPPLSQLRFKHPQPHEGWQGVYNATALPPMCVQEPETGVYQSEDCLYLNIYVPNSFGENKNKTVMVWIHGGGFIRFSPSMYDGRYLAGFTDVIVVAISYRVGALGFLSLEIPQANGNAGMLDQVMALKWVQNNIRNFGGDPEIVTLFGESAGGASVGLHLVSPLSADLFSKGILQSGTSANLWASYTQEEARHRAHILATRLGCNTQEADEDILNCLLSASPEDIAEMQIGFTTIEVTWRPVTDGFFLTELPKVSMENGRFKKCPIMIGLVQNEGNYFLLRLFPEYLDSDEPTMTYSQFTECVETIHGEYPCFPNGTTEEGLDALMFEYTTWEDVEDRWANIAQLDHMYADKEFTCSLQYNADVYAASGQPVYFFMFSERFEGSPYPEWAGVLHMDEIAFVFAYDYLGQANFTEEERVLSAEMMKHWANFAKTGDPNVDDNGMMTLSEWPIYTVESRDYKELNADVIFDPESIKSGCLRCHQCAMYNWYLPKLDPRGPGNGCH